MLTNNKFHNPVRHEQNRVKFAREQDLKGNRQRNALFSMPVGLTVGDASTNYQTYRRERHEVGQNRGMTVNQSRGAKETFGRFTSNALGDPYQDPGKYIMRSPARGTIKPKPFTTSGNKLVRKSEFPYMPIGPPARPVPETAPRFATRVKAEPLSQFSRIGHMLEPYERKQDMGRDEYVKQNQKIIHRDQPWSNCVRQKGCFYPNKTTFGTNVAFPQIKAEVKKEPLFGPFRKGDMLKTGYNKCIGGRNGTSEEAYMEEVETDPVHFHKNVKANIWRGVTNDRTMMNSTTINNQRNVNKERANIF